MNEVIKEAKALAAKLAKLAETEPRAWKAARKVQAAVELLEEKPAAETPKPAN